MRVNKWMNPSSVSLWRKMAIIAVTAMDTAYIQQFVDVKKRWVNTRFVLPRPMRTHSSELNSHKLNRMRYFDSCNANIFLNSGIKVILLSGSGSWMDTFLPFDIRLGLTGLMAFKGPMQVVFVLLEDLKKEPRLNAWQRAQRCQTCWNGAFIRIRNWIPGFRNLSPLTR